MAHRAGVLHYMMIKHIYIYIYGTQLRIGRVLCLLFFVYNTITVVNKYSFVLCVKYGNYIFYVIGMLMVCVNLYTGFLLLFFNALYFT